MVILLKLLPTKENALKIIGWEPIKITWEKNLQFLQLAETLLEASENLLFHPVLK